MSARGYRLGIDTGGTHTDLVLVDEETGRTWVDKVPSTPQDPSIGVLEGIERMTETVGISPAELTTLVYGTTVMVNQILQGEGTTCGLITTTGFSDVLELGRSYRMGSIYNLQWEPPHPIVPRHLRIGVQERVDFRGRVLTPLDESDVRQAAKALAEAGVESVAVSLLHSYRNPTHEQQVAEILAEQLPQAYISISSELSPTIGEYERTSTACLDALVKPRLAEHFATLRERIRKLGSEAVLLTMQGNGGTMPFEAAQRSPIRVTNSGPVAGVIAGAALANRLQLNALITVDMGGTSTDVALVLNGAPSEVPSDSMRGHPIQQPAIEVEPIGAGGGSIAWVDDGGALRVGPKSAGADPGPACYCRGGTLPTVTDAALVLGYLNSEAFLGGRRKLSLEAAVEAVQSDIATPLGMTLHEAAQGVISIAAATGLRSIRRITVARGRDPRHMALAGFGGAGGLIAAQLGRELGVRQVIVPVAPGNSSAKGLLLTDQRYDAIRVYTGLIADADVAALEAEFCALEERCNEQLDKNNVPISGCSVSRYMELRYLGQTFELVVPCGSLTTPGAIPAIERAFHDAHATRYGHASPNDPIQLVNLRVTGVGATPRPTEPRLTESLDAVPEPRTTRRVYFGQWHDAPIYERAQLARNHAVLGPAVVEEPTSTIVILPNQRACVGSDGSLIISDDLRPDITEPS